MTISQIDGLIKNYSYLIDNNKNTIQDIKDYRELIEFREKLMDINNKYGHLI